MTFKSGEKVVELQARSQTSACCLILGFGVCKCDTTGKIQAIFVATKLSVFNKTLGGFPYNLQRVAISCEIFNSFYSTNKLFVCMQL